jgi:D-serine dehydratase
VCWEGGGRGWDFYFNALADRKKNRFCIVAEKKYAVTGYKQKYCTAVSYARKKISEPSSIKIFFSHEKESKKFFSYHVEQKYIFP